MSSDPVTNLKPPNASKSRHTSLTQGALLNWLSLGLNFGSSFVVTPIIIHKLGTVGFGMWALIQSFSGYYGLVNLGLASALQRFISRDFSKGDWDSLQQTVGTAITFFAGSGLLVLITAVFLRDPASQFFNIPTTDSSTFGITLVLCAVAVVADFFGALVTTMFTARERFDMSNGLSIGRQILQTGGILLILGSFASIMSIALVVCLVSVLSLVAGFLLVSSLYPGTSLNGRGRCMKRLKELLHYGSSTVLLTISNIVRLRLGNLVIARSSGLAAVGMFTMASNLVLQMNSIMASSFNVLNPRFARLHAQDRQSDLQSLYRTALFVSSSLACGMGLMMLIFGERFIIFWVGTGLLPAVPILNVLTIAYVVALAQSPSWNLMFALAQHHYMSRVTIIEACIIVVLGFWLSPTYGAIGFAWATAAPMVITKVFLHPPYSAKLAGLSLRAYLAPMSIPFLTAVSLWCVAWNFGMTGLLRNGGLLQFLSLSTAFGVTYCAIVAFLARHQCYAKGITSKIIGRRSIVS